MLTPAAKAELRAKQGGKELGVIILAAEVQAVQKVPCKWNIVHTGNEKYA